jgi:hypothetical protein
MYLGRLPAEFEVPAPFGRVMTELRHQRAALLFLGSLPAFLGLPVVLPVLGHSTWHLYRKMVEPDPHPRPEYRPQPRRQRYAADFPAVLLPWSKEDR